MELTSRLKCTGRVPPLVTKSGVLAELRREQAVDGAFAVKLEALRPPDTEAGQRGRALIDSTPFETLVRRLTTSMNRPR